MGSSGSQYCKGEDGAQQLPAEPRWKPGSATYIQVFLVQILLFLRVLAPAAPAVAPAHAAAPSHAAPAAAAAVPSPSAAAA